MKRIPLLAATAAIAIAATGVIATAQDGSADPSKTRPDRAAMMLERFDTNGDGTITREEVAAVQLAHFAEADTDGDGQLSAEELAAAHEARRMERRQAGLERMINRLDENGDGVLSVEEAAAAGPRRDMFDRLDADEDGTITTAELENARGGPRGMGRGHGEGHGEGHARGEGRGHGHGHGKAPWWGRGNN